MLHEFRNVPKLASGGLLVVVLVIDLLVLGIERRARRRAVSSLGRAARTGSPVRTLEDGIERSRLFERARVKRPSQRRLGVFSLVPRPQSLGARRIEIHRRAREG